MNHSRLRLSLLAPLLAVLALLLGLAGSASAAFNAAATDPHYGNFLLHTEAPARMPLAIADSSREIGVWLYDSTLGVPVYVRQNPWSKFDPLGLVEANLEGIKQVLSGVNYVFNLFAEKVDTYIADPISEKITGLTARQVQDKVVAEVEENVPGGQTTVAVTGIVLDLRKGRLPDKKDLQRLERKADDISEEFAGPIVNGQTRAYGEFKDFPGDGLVGHEMLQNAKLKQMGVDSAAKKTNPALALTSEQHKEVTKLQRKAGLHNPANLAKQTPAQNVRANVKVTKEADVVSRSDLAEAAKKAREQAKKVEGGK